MNKKGLEFSFAWLFAIIAGAVIIFIAIFIATKYVSTSENIVNTKTASEFINVLDPLQSGVAESSSNRLELRTDARVYTSCDTSGNFGSTRVSFSERIGLGGKFSSRGKEIKSENAYLFAEDELESREIRFLIFSIKLPFKVGDEIIAYSGDYCFVNAPRNIERELGDLTESRNLGIIFSDDLESCPVSKRVCFSGSCDVNIRCSDSECKSGFVDKDRSRVYFVDKLVYGAIFSSSENYECNVQRVVKRTNILSDIYSKKSQFMASRGCNSGSLIPDLNNLYDLTKNYDSLDDLPEGFNLARDFEEKNDNLECELY